MGGRTPFLLSRSVTGACSSRPPPTPVSLRAAKNSVKAKLRKKSEFSCILFLDFNITHSFVHESITSTSQAPSVFFAPTQRLTQQRLCVVLSPSHACLGLFSSEPVIPIPAERFACALAFVSFRSGRACKSPSGKRTTSTFKPTLPGINSGLGNGRFGDRVRDERVEFAPLRPRHPDVDQACQRRERAACE